VSRVRRKGSTWEKLIESAAVNGGLEELSLMRTRSMLRSGDEEVRVTWSFTERRIYTGTAYPVADQKHSIEEK
jgi:hypothetical protein